ncbi:MAG TPA: hypothetical protein PLQ21_08960, partial [Candidatus Kapabacteria bacterium]|nr:hypothetical protein [Candidatus Kapabacteria bacterium]
NENDCALVWEENNPYFYDYQIFSTRLRVQNGTIIYGLSPDYVPLTGADIIFNNDTTIMCLTNNGLLIDTTYSYHFPVVYRELWEPSEDTLRCNFSQFYPGHTSIDFHLDRVVWEAHLNGSPTIFLGERGYWYYDTTIAGVMQPNQFGVGWRGNLWLSGSLNPFNYFNTLQQPSLSAGTAAYYESNPIMPWSGCVNGYTQRAMNLTFKATSFFSLDTTSVIYSLPQTHAYPPIREFVKMIDKGFVTQSHVAARGSVLLNDWWRNHRIYNKTVDNGIVLDPYQIRSSGQHYYRFGQDNALRSLSVASFGNENGSFGIGTPIINDEEYMLYPYSTMPQRMEHPYYQTIDTLATAWFRVGDDEQLRYSFSGSNPQQATAYLERKSDGAQWILPSMPLREYTLSRLELTLFNGNEEEYRIVTYG